MLTCEFGKELEKLKKIFQYFYAQSMAGRGQKAVKVQKRNGRLLRKQMSFIEELVRGKKVLKLLKEKKIAIETLALWLENPLFVRELRFRREVMRLDSLFLISRNGYEAAETLVTLMRKGEGEPKRKACLDILKAGEIEDKKTAPAEKSKKPAIDEAKARRVLLEAARRR